MPDTDKEDTMVRTEIYMPPELRDAAEEIGGGVMAEGIRIAVRREKERQEES